MSLTNEAIETLKGVSTATLTTALLKRGLRNVWIRNAKPIRAGLCRTPLARPPGRRPLRGLTVVGWQETIGCGGVAVIPGLYPMNEETKKGYKAFKGRK